MTTTFVTNVAADRPRRRRNLPTALRLAGAELRLMTREPGVLVGLIAFPLVTVLVIAGSFGQSPDPDFGGVRPDQYYLSGYLGVVLAALGLLTIPTHLATSRELGVLRRFRASGIGPVTLVLSEIALGTVLAMVAAAVVLVTGAQVYGLQAPANLLGVLAWFGLGLACFLAIGGALGSLLRSGRSAAAIGNLLFVPMFLLGGGGPPRAVMTSAMRTISDVLPLTHIVSGLRQSWLGTTDGPHNIWWPVVVTVLALGVSITTARRRTD
ncbi:MAG: ABC transporter permease [Acidimicrobiales bacterium]